MYQRSDFTVLSVETIISADNVHCDVRGEGEEGCDVKIINLMPHAKRSMQTTLFGTVVRVLFSWLGFELVMLRGGEGTHT